MGFNAEDVDEEMKEKSVERIEHAMQNHCEDCETSSTDNLKDMCQKHLKMYGALYP